jgi:hypothetical protein
MASGRATPRSSASVWSEAEAETDSAEAGGTKVIAHVVLFRPKADLPLEDRRALVAAFERAIRTIPTVRAVSVGRRVRHGAGYEQAAPDDADYLVTIQFDDLDGLRVYLAHPAHQELGARFGRSQSAGAVYDFDVGGLEALQQLI